MTNDEIKEISRINNLFKPEDYLPDDYEPLTKEEEQELEETLIYAEIEPLIEDFIALSAEEKHIFHKTVKYILEFDNEEEYLYDADISKTFLSLQTRIETLINKNDNASLSERQKIIEEKSYLTVEEFELKYGDSETVQQELRRLPKNKRIPFIQKKKRGKITYSVRDVERWLENNAKN